MNIVLWALGTGGITGAITVPYTAIAYIADDPDNEYVAVHLVGRIG
ncbi:MAG: hypothetical protein ABJB33_03850 [Gemmatimonadota bacterium]